MVDGLLLNNNNNYKSRLNFPEDNAEALFLDPGLAV